jgi:hypothetical protein
MVISEHVSRIRALAEQGALAGAAVLVSPADHGT